MLRVVPILALLQYMQRRNAMTPSCIVCYFLKLPPRLPMLLPVIFGLRAVCHVKDLLAFLFKSVRSGFHQGTFLRPLVRRPGQDFSKELTNALFRLFISRSISTGEVTLPIHIPMDLFNFWSYSHTDQLVHLGLRLKLGGFSLRFNVN